jgi:pimeloyl-ACP methyl ester carboxylesterase
MATTSLFRKTIRVDRHGQRRWRDAWHCMALVLLLAMAACSPPMSVERVDLRTAYDELNRTALSGDRLSETTRIVLRRSALLDNYENAPDATIGALRAQAIQHGMPWRTMFALAELSYLRGRQTNSKTLLLASAIYAYAALFPDGDADRPDPYSAQFRQACDFYNLALTQVLTTSDGEGATLRSGRFGLPFGTIDVALDSANISTGGRELTSFVPTMNLAVQGFQNDYRSDGLGAPLAARLAQTAPTQPTGQPGLEFAPNLRVPTSAILQVPDPRRQLASAELKGTLSVHAIFDTMSIRIGTRDVPLEFDQTAVRALFLTEGRGWTTEIAGLFDNTRLDTSTTTRLFAIEPHRRGRIPVVLVHGTASSPFRWADMVNDLAENQTIRDHFEFWLFRYNTGNPIPASSLLLRQSLEQAVQYLGGVQSDPALGRMVVIGHSQGGLLTKLLVIDSGTKIWDAISTRPLDELDLTPATRELLRNALFLHPLPFIESVVFIATPHRGSYLASFSLLNLVTRFITLPLTLISASAELLTTNRDALRVNASATRFNSLAGMSPNNPLLETAAAIPIAPPIRAHSIIPTLGDGPLETRDDGVVEYKSAHIAGLESELVIQSGHSVQANPLAVAEVQRILLEQLARTPPVAQAPAPAQTRPATTARRPMSAVTATEPRAQR